MKISQENLYVDIRPWRAKLKLQIAQENNWSGMKVQLF